MIGKTILHYKVLKELGRGGMGIVYKAEDGKLKREVAIKFLPHHIAANTEERARFNIEAQAAAALNHPNIATIYAIEKHDDEMFIVMEYIEGLELREMIVNLAKVRNLRKVLDIASQIASGLQAAHEKGIIHRDIKSANIMLTDKGQIKIMDFGLAKIRGGVQLTIEGATLGTVAYMSPEQTHGIGVDHRTDIWSFGVVLYEMLTGQLPFKGDYEQAVIYSIMHEEPTSISEIREEVPPELVQVAEKALRKQPSERYHGVEEMLVDLKGLDKSFEAAVSKPKTSETPGFKLTPGETAATLTVSKEPRTWSMVGIPALLMALVVVAGMLVLRDRTGAIATLAILPFSNENTEGEFGYIADGIPETVIFRLSQLPGLKIRSLSSVSRYREALPDLRKVARDLEVEAVLTGKVFLRNQNLAVVVELVDGKDNTTIWGHTYSMQLTDLLAIQEEITHDILTHLRAELSGEQQQRLKKSYTVNSDAYQAYLKGRYFEKRRGEENLRKSLDYYRAAVDLDPGYALAYSGLSDARFLLGVYGFSDYRQAYPKAKIAAERAIQIDDEIAEAHTSLGRMLVSYGWNFSGAEKEYRRAIELNPSYAEAHHLYGYLLSGLGRHDEATKEAKAGLELEPLSPVMNRGLGTMYLMARNYREAVRFYHTCLELNPRSLSGLWYLTQAYFHLNQFDDSIAMAERYLRAASNEALADSVKQSYERAGYDAALRQLTKSNDAFLTNAYLRAIIFALLGDKEACLSLVEKAVEERTALLWLNVQPAFDSVRSDPRFVAQVKKMFGNVRA